MRTVVIAALVFFSIAGCAEKPEQLANPPEGEQTETVTTEQAQGSGEGIGIVSPASGGMSPVTGSDTVTGSGGGSVGGAAKDQAKRIGGGQSQGSLGNATADEEGGY